MDCWNKLTVAPHMSAADWWRLVATERKARRERVLLEDPLVRAGRSPTRDSLGVAASRIALLGLSAVALSGCVMQCRPTGPYGESYCVPAQGYQVAPTYQPVQPMVRPGYAPAYPPYDPYARWTTG